MGENIEIEGSQVGDEQLRDAFSLAVEMATLFSAEEWQARIFVLMMILSFSQRNDIVRLPLFLMVNECSDVVALHRFIKVMLRSLIHAQGLSHASLIQMFAELDSPTDSDSESITKQLRTLVMDLTSATPGNVASIKRLATIRSVPGICIDLKRGDALAAVAVYGSSFFIIPDALAGSMEEFALVLDFTKRDTAQVDMDAFVRKLEGAESALMKLGNSLALETKESDLEPNRFISSTMRRGFLNLASVARSVDAL